MIDNILLTASIIAALVTIIGTSYKIMKMFHNVMNKIEDIEKQIKDNALHILKLAILEENMPPAERLKCGEAYVKLGGNGQIKKIYERLLEDTEELTQELKRRKRADEDNVL